MGIDWLYGKTVEGSIGYGMTTRSMTLDITTIEEILDDLDADLVRRGHGPEGAKIWIQAGRDSKYIDRSSLSSAPTWQLNNLQVQGDISIFFGPKYAPTVNSSSLDAESEALALSIAKKITSEGEPRPRVLALIRFLPVPLMVALVIAWMWLLFTVEVAPPLVLFGSLLLIFALTAGVFFFVWFRGWAAKHVPGHTIRQVSRRQVAETRANSKRDVKVSVWSILGSALILIPLTVALETLWNPNR